MYTLYGSRGCGSAAVEAALDWAGLPWTHIEAASWLPGEGLEALSAVNPLRQIPTLVLPDGSVMTESAAILIHLGLAEPGSGLLPAEPSARAQAIRGLVYIAANCYSAVSIIDFPERWSDDAQDAQAVQQHLQRGARHQLHAHWDIFADQFLAPHAARGEAFIGGAEPGALDLLATVVSKWSGARQHLQGSRPDFHAMLLRVERHPRLVELFEKHWPTHSP